MIWFILLAAIGCTSLPLQETVKDAVYRHDLSVKVNGAPAVTGAGIASLSASYRIEIESLGDIDYLTVQSCHREEVLVDLDSKKAAYHYTPTAIEVGYCPLRFGAYEKGKGRHGWAMLDFEDAQGLDGTLNCNGQVSRRKTSVCQSRAGLIQQITFAENVDVQGSCPNISGRSKVFQFEVESGFCVYDFFDGAKSHRLTAIGYEEILFRQ